MIVAELIEALSKLPAELPVMASDYENGTYGITYADVREPFGVFPWHVELS
jgi:hypothetical protein